jgi:carbonic anhydrase
MNSKITIIVSLAFFCNLLASGFAIAADANASADPHWTYGEQEGWAEQVDQLYKPPYPYAECGIGQKQSPVDIEQSNVVNVKKIDGLKPSYVQVPLSLTNNGHTIRVNIAKGKMYFGNNEYDLLQFHFHAPSEHLLNGVRYPMEIHFVNGNEDGRMAVIGVFIEPGAFNLAFQEIIDEAPGQVGQTANPRLLIRPNQLLPKHINHFYTYTGSLTTPPCNEGVQWFILKEALQVSESQIKMFKDKFYFDNARSEQKLNGRKVDLH